MKKAKANQVEKGQASEEGEPAYPSFGEIPMEEGEDDEMFNKDDYQLDQKNYAALKPWETNVNNCIYYMEKNNPELIVIAPNKRGEMSAMRPNFMLPAGRGIFIHMEGLGEIPKDGHDLALGFMLTFPVIPELPDQADHRNRLEKTTKFFEDLKRKLCRFMARNPNCFKNNYESVVEKNVLPNVPDTLGKLFSKIDADGREKNFNKLTTDRRILYGIVAPLVYKQFMTTVKSHWHPECKYLEKDVEYVSRWYVNCNTKTFRKFGDKEKEKSFEETFPAIARCLKFPSHKPERGWADTVYSKFHLPPEKNGNDLVEMRRIYAPPRVFKKGPKYVDGKLLRDQRGVALKEDVLFAPFERTVTNQDIVVCVVNCGPYTGAGFFGMLNKLDTVEVVIARPNREWKHDKSLNAYEGIKEDFPEYEPRSGSGGSGDDGEDSDMGRPRPLPAAAPISGAKRGYEDVNNSNGGLPNPFDDPIDARGHQGRRPPPPPHHDNEFDGVDEAN